MRQTTQFARGAVRLIGESIAQRKPASIFLVTGRSSYVKSGAAAVVQEILHECKTTHFNDFGLNPKLEDVKKGLQILQDNECDLIIAVGGGSVIDMAKLVGILATQAAYPEDIVTGRERIRADSIPLIAAPTTSGTGSEATHFAVVYLHEKKYSVAHPSMLPGVAILDPALTDSLPPKFTATSGLDALAQAVESMWCIRSTGKSRDFSRESIRLTLDNLRGAIHHPSQKERDVMCRAAHLSGKAINITKTTAPHAISYTMTSAYGVDHGHAVALTLGPVLHYNAQVTNEDVADPRGVKQVLGALDQINALFGCDDSASTCRAIMHLIEAVGLPSRLRDVGIITAEDRARLVANTNTERLATNPRKLTPAALGQLLESIA